MSDLSLDQALSCRRTIRQFGERAIPLDVLKRLIWAAQGITSQDGKKTAPSAHALHPLRLFCLPRAVEGLERGLYGVEPGELEVAAINTKDLRDSLRQTCIDAPNGSPTPPASS